LLFHLGKPVHRTHKASLLIASGEVAPVGNFSLKLFDLIGSGQPAFAIGRMAWRATEGR
jgi:hypothetical protein